MASQSLFQQLGLPTMSREDALLARRREETKVFNDLITKQAANVAPAERAVFQAFANVGHALAGGGAHLTQDEERKFKAIEIANVKLKELQSSPDWQGYSPEDRALASKKALADSLMESGDVAGYTELAAQIVKEKLAADKARKEMASLDARTAASNASKAASEAKAASTVADQFDNQYVVPGPDGKVSLDGEPTTFTGGYDHERGGFVSTDGKVYKNALPFSDYLDMKENRDKNVRANTKAAGGGLGNFFKAIPAKKRDQYSSAAQQATRTKLITDKVFGLIENRIDSGEAPETILGTSGSVMRFVGDVGNTIKGLAKSFETGERAQFSGKIGVGGERQADGSLSDAKWMTLDEYAATLGDEFKLPQGIENGSKEAALYKSTMMEMFYLSALSSEPGSRALSDQDIRNAMDRLGGLSGDPEVVVQRLYDNSMAAYNDLFASVNVVKTQAATPGIDVNPDDAVRIVFGLSDLSNAEKERNELMERHNRILGKAAARSAPPTQTKPQGRDWAKGLPSSTVASPEEAKAARVAEIRAKMKAKQAAGAK